MSIAALILAAGSSSRMGRPKALLDYRGSTFLLNIINTARNAAIEHIIVAVSRSDDKIISELELHAVSVVRNAEPEAAGPLGSIRSCLLSIVNQAVEYAMVWPVDQPHILQTTIRQLADHAEAGHPDILVPTFQGQRGHPVLFSRQVFPELLAAPDEEGARYVVRRVPERVTELPVVDRAVLEDIDTPQDYEKLISSTKSLL